MGGLWALCSPTPGKYFATRGPIFGEIWGTLLYHRSPLSWYHLGNGVPQNIWGTTSPAFPLDYTTAKEDI